MNRITLSLLAALLIMVSGCEYHDIYGEEFLVIVESQGDMACGLPVVRFVQPSDRLETKTSSKSLHYHVMGLDSELNVPGNEVLVRFHMTPPEDMTPCLAIGIWYPRISILEARVANPGK